MIHTTACFQESKAGRSASFRWWSISHIASASHATNLHSQAPIVVTLIRDLIWDSKGMKMHWKDGCLRCTESVNKHSLMPWVSKLIRMKMLQHLTFHKEPKIYDGLKKSRKQLKFCSHILISESYSNHFETYLKQRIMESWKVRRKKWQKGCYIRLNSRRKIFHLARERQRVMKLIY